MDIISDQIDFPRTTNFKLLSQIQANSINNCHFSKAHNFQLNNGTPDFPSG
jgi:hypothetical protein